VRGIVSLLLAEIRIQIGQRMSSLFRCQQFGLRMTATEDRILRSWNCNARMWYHVCIAKHVQHVSQALNGNKWSGQFVQLLSNL